jgi:hypothetical protein
MLVLSLFGPCCPGIRINDKGGHKGRPYGTERIESGAPLVGARDLDMRAPQEPNG